LDLLRPRRRYRRRSADATPAFDVVERDEAEEILAAARFVVALVYASLVGPYASHFGGLAAVLLAYVGYAAALYFAASHRAGLGRGTVIAVHAVDLLIPLAVAFAGPESEGARGSYAASTLYLVPLVQAAMRWGAGVTLATMIVAVAAALVQVVGPGTAPLVRYDAIASLLVAGSLLAFIGLLQQRTALRRAAIARLREGCQAAHSFKASMLIALRALTALFRARGARLTARSTESGRLVRWDFDAQAPPEQRLRFDDLSETPDSPEIGAAAPWLSATFGVGDWTGRIEIVEPAGRKRTTRHLRLLERTVRDVAPAVGQAYLRAQTRSRAVREERLYLARELHDGPIQSLIGAEMGLDAVRRRAEMDGATSAFGAQLAQAQAILRQEIVTLRELMVRMKPLDLPPDELPAYLAQTVRRFTMDSGIRAELVSDPGPWPSLLRHHVAGLARIVQEALINVRKHSGATRVIVTLRSEGDEVHLTIEDNGRGFDPQLAPWAPDAIRDVVKDLQGQLAIHSTQGRGARVHVVLPAALSSAARTGVHQVAS
jgi:signal transduction histidine kinase